MFKPIANFVRGVVARVTGRKPTVTAKSPTEKSFDAINIKKAFKVRGLRKTRSTDGFRVGQTVKLSWAKRIKAGQVFAIHTEKLGVHLRDGTVIWKAPSAVRAV